MSLLDQVTADKQAVETARLALEQAFAQLQTDQAKLDAIAPHLSVLAEIEQFMDRVDQSARDEFAALIAKAKALF